MLEINDVVLYCIALHCIALHCTALHCIVQILKGCTPKQGVAQKQRQRIWQRVGSIHTTLNLFAEKVVVEEDRPDCANVNVDVVYPNVLPPSEVLLHCEFVV